jgi:hypothetical protein
MDSASRRKSVLPERSSAARNPIDLYPLCGTKNSAPDRIERAALFHLHLSTPWPHLGWIVGAGVAVAVGGPTTCTICVALIGP